MTSAYTVKSSIVAYDNIGNEVTLDVYMTKTATGPGYLGSRDLRPVGGGGQWRLPLRRRVRSVTRT